MNTSIDRINRLQDEVTRYKKSLADHESALHRAQVAVDSIADKLTGLQYVIRKLQGEVEPAMMDYNSDDETVDRFSRLMKAKLATSRAQGKSDWWDPVQCGTTDLINQYVAHLIKTNEGNFIDIANYCMMLHMRGIDPGHAELRLDRLTLSFADVFIHHAKLAVIGESHD